MWTALSLLLALAALGGGGWAVWRRALERGQARKEVEREQTQKAMEAKEREAKRYAEPAPATWDDTVDRL